MRTDQIQSKRSRLDEEKEAEKRKKALQNQPITATTPAVSYAQRAIRAESAGNTGLSEVYWKEALRQEKRQGTDISSLKPSYSVTPASAGRLAGTAALATGVPPLTPKWQQDYTPSTEFSVVGKKSTGLSPGQKVTGYTTYAEAAESAKTLSEEVRKQKRQTARTGETWEVELATSVRDKAIKYMSDHASEAAAKTSLKVEGMSGRQIAKEQVKKWQKEADALSKSKDPDVDKLQKLHRDIATWKKALSETEKSIGSFPGALFSGLSFEEAGNVTTEKYTQYTKAKQSFDKLYGNLNNPSSALGYQSAYITLERLRQEYLAGVNYMVTHYRESKIDDSWREHSYTTYRDVYQTEMNLLQDRLERLLDEKNPDPLILSDVLTEIAQKQAQIDNATIEPDEHVLQEMLFGNYAQTRTIEGQILAFLVGLTPLRVIPDALNVMYVIDHWESTSFKQKALTFMNALPYLGKLGQLAKGAKYADEAGQAAALLDQAEDISNALAVVAPEAGSMALTTISQTVGEYGSLASQIGRGSNLVKANLTDRGLDIFTQHQGVGSGRSFAPGQNSGIISLQTDFSGGYRGPTYSERGIELPQNIRENLNRLQSKGDMIVGRRGDFSEMDASVMSRETGVEYAHITIGDSTYLVRGNNKGTDISYGLLGEIAKNGGTLDYHTHPYDGDRIPSQSDMNLMAELERLTGQTESQIITPNGDCVIFDKFGVKEIRTVDNTLTHEEKMRIAELFGGKLYDD